MKRHKGRRKLLWNTYLMVSSCLEYIMTSQNTGAGRDGREHWVLWTGKVKPQWAPNLLSTGMAQMKGRVYTLFSAWQKIRMVLNVSRGTGLLMCDSWGVNGSAPCIGACYKTRQASFGGNIWTELEILLSEIIQAQKDICILQCKIYNVDLIGIERIMGVTQTGERGKWTDRQITES